MTYQVYKYKNGLFQTSSGPVVSLFTGHLDFIRVQEVLCWTSVTAEAAGKFDPDVLLTYYILSRL
ncbi:hypothetical protein, partial [Salmonella sp. gx-f7]|uniref:hypothetical protein n=1 Tax=Salmonella sp. gx-f7 TaxID=2582606 RepID=UPI001F3550CD